jgi:hypothetical protein
MHRLPIDSSKVLVAVSNPKDTGICSFLRSPSMVLGHPITLHFAFYLAKYSDKRQAFVFESSPPITTRPSISIVVTV